MRITRIPYSSQIFFISDGNSFNILIDHSLQILQSFDSLLNWTSSSRFEEDSLSFDYLEFKRLEKKEEWRLL